MCLVNRLRGVVGTCRPFQIPPPQNQKNNTKTETKRKTERDLEDYFTPFTTLTRLGSHALSQLLFNKFDRRPFQPPSSLHRHQGPHNDKTHTTPLFRPHSDDGDY